MVAEGPAPPVTKVTDVVSTFRPTRLFKSPPGAQYTSVDFDDSGEFLLLSRSDDTIQLFNTKAGAHAKELKSQKYGSALARFTHHSTSILYASTKQNDGIRYLSMHDNSFIRYFQGHKARVTSLAVSPSNDQFMSASLDGTVKLWDCRSPNPQGQLDFMTVNFATYDASASVIAVAATEAQTICLYDLRNFDKPPFTTFDLEQTESRFQHLGQRPCEGWTGMEFSNNGKYMLISTNGPGHYLLDAFDGRLLHYLKRPQGADRQHYAPCDPLPPNLPHDNTPSYIQTSACFSPDGNFVIGGNGTGTGLSVWECGTEASSDQVLDPTADLPSTKSAKVVAYNPRHNLVASADKEVMMWLPDPDMA